ncbi:hypothetical protein [Marinomonas transparens]|uniref:Uncharacterized protein n=1 Tax=Marinomonas transparens TaxID=2795388 RepID=A0A934JSU0_9GAMM|nr:hypothetical protein [Marinomonas transparens]MBJ7536644.1 hypothetical protein [Marinomonas transparens]
MNITLTDVHEAIIDALKTRFPSVTIEGYDASKDLAALAPAALLEVEALSKTADSGDGRYPVQARFSVHCAVGADVENRQLALMEFAVALSQFVSESGIWVVGSLLEKPFYIDAYPTNFRNEALLDQNAWTVSWEQKLYLGESTWQAEAERGGIRVALNPNDEDDATEYRSL